MKPRHIFLAILVLSASLILSGCTNYDYEYFFSFKDEQDLSNANGTWILECDYPDDYSFNSKGINLQNANLACPWRFSGDIRVTVRFWLNVNEDYYYWLGLGLSDSTWWCGLPANDVHMDMEYLGYSDWEYYYIADHDTLDGEDAVHYEDDGVFKGLRKNGFNEYVLTKTGNKIVAKMNGVSFASFTLEEYDSEWFGPNLGSAYMNYQSPLYGATFESIKIEYSGSVSPMPD